MELQLYQLEVDPVLKRLVAPMNSVELHEMEEEIKLNQEHRGTLKSAVLLSEIHPFNGTVFGLFLPKVCYIFKNKKDSCKLLIDFSLKQVHVEVEDSMQIYTLHDNVLLKESILLFPEDRYMPDLLRLSL